jgi:purine-binding chemotaxis protein CheW
VEIVLIEMNKNEYAFTADCVERVLDPLPVTPLPFVAKKVDGLVNVDGHVLPQINLSVVLDDDQPVILTGDEEEELKQLLVIHSQNGTCSVLVDHVSKMIELDDDFIVDLADDAEELEEDEDAVENEHSNHFFKGEFQYENKTIMLLNQDVLSVGQSHVDFSGENSGILGKVGSQLSNDGDEVIDVPYLLIDHGTEQFALSLSYTREITEIIEMTEIPGAPKEVAGIVSIRNKPILVLSLTAMLKIDEEIDPKVLVIVEIQSHKMGLLVEKVASLQRFKEDALHTVKEMNQDFAGYLQGDNDEMIAVLALDALIDEKKFKKFSRYLVDNEKKNHNDVDLMDEKLRMLTFYVGEEYCALDLATIERIEEYSESSMLPPSDSDKNLVSGLTIDGVIQVHGEVFPVIDLRRLFSVDINNTNFTAHIIVRIDDKGWVLVVDKIDRVIEIKQRDIDDVSKESEKSGVLGAVAKYDERLISVLDTEFLTGLRLH